MLTGFICCNFLIYGPNLFNSVYHTSLLIGILQYVGPVVLKVLIRIYSKPFQERQHIYQQHIYHQHIYHQHIYHQHIYRLITRNTLVGQAVKGQRCCGTNNSVTRPLADKTKATTLFTNFTCLTSDEHRFEQISVIVAWISLEIEQLDLVKEDKNLKKIIWHQDNYMCLRESIV